MGRKSSLTPEQWIAIERRLLDGEARRALAREYGISETAIRLKLSSRVEKIKEVTNQIVAAHKGLQSLPITSQITAQSNAAKVISIQNNMIGAAENGAVISHRLMGIARMKVEEIDDAAPLNEESAQTLKGIAVLTRMANESSEIGINLLRANKDGSGPNLREIDITPENGLTPEEEYLKFIG